ncbi:hypothetical protein CBR_g41167 [Chara braunii]|uniref:Uncharacterized protein n=1 Tax=Chara braunii TaxID=69332 RepID=A0A388K2H7_CHABU|nr:hypothetical protein CBR_g41167 [Chara braunii]|eukprot:GBG64246.1 hypothetical protein CBR_g41167 [Chara braunii]
MDGLLSVPLPVLSGDEVLNELRRHGKHSNWAKFRAMYSSVIGGVTTDPAAMVISLDDHMVHRGHAVFDTAMVVNGYAHELEAHLDRLFRSMAMAKLSPPFLREILRDVILKTAGISQCRDGQIRYWVSAGPGGFGLLPSECPRSAFYVVVFDQPLFSVDTSGYGGDGRISVDVSSSGGDERMTAAAAARQQKQLILRTARAITTSVPIKPPPISLMKTNNYIQNVMAGMEAVSYTHLDVGYGGDGRISVDVSSSGGDERMTAAAAARQQKQLILRTARAITTSVPIKPPPISLMKTNNYIQNVMAGMEAAGQGADVAVWIDQEGYLAEGPTVSILIVSQDGYLTRPTSDTALRGCTAERVMELTRQRLIIQGHMASSTSLIGGQVAAAAAAMGGTDRLARLSKPLPLQGVRVQRIPIEEARRAKEMFIVGSTSPVQPIVEWDGRLVCDGRPGPVPVALYEMLEADMRFGETNGRRTQAMRMAPLKLRLWADVSARMKEANYLREDDECKNWYHFVRNNYRLVKDHNRWSGNQKYWSMDQATRKTHALDFLMRREWYNIIHVHEGHKHTINPDSLTDPGAESHNRASAHDSDVDDNDDDTADDEVVGVGSEGSEGSEPGSSRGRGGSRKGGRGGGGGSDTGGTGGGVGSDTGGTGGGGGSHTNETGGGGSGGGVALPR